MSLAELDETTQYLTFKLQDEVFAFDISKVREVLDFTTITKVPRTPEFMRGVINLRGSVVPVVDLRLKFGMEEMSYTERTCIIVAEMQGMSGSIQMGIVVDSVSEVLNIKGVDVEGTPPFGAKLDTDYILGMAKMNGGVKILLDIDKVLSAHGTGLVGEEGTINAQ